MLLNPAHSQLAEDVLKSSHDAAFLSEHLRDAHKRACEQMPLLAELLAPLIAKTDETRAALEHYQNLLHWKA